jgi:hypothetical protein
MISSRANRPTLLCCASVVLRQEVSMQRVVPILLIVVRIAAILAVLGSIFIGLLASMVAGFTCFDTCPTRDDFFATFVPAAMRLLLWCVPLPALALVLFLVYCLATRQPRRALIVLLAFIAGGLLGFAALNGLVEQARTTLPVNEYGLVDSSWPARWAGILLVVAMLWSGGLACLEWGRRWRSAGNTQNHA